RDTDHIITYEECFTTYELHFIPFEQRIDATDLLANDVILELLNLRIIQLHILRDHTHRFALLRCFIVMGCRYQRLRRDTAAVQTDTTDLVLIDTDDGLAELCSADRCHIPAWSGTHD